MFSQVVRVHCCRNKAPTNWEKWVVSLHASNIRMLCRAVQETGMAQWLCSRLEFHYFPISCYGWRQFNHPWLPCTPGAGASSAASLRQPASSAAGLGTGAGCMEGRSMGRDEGAPGEPLTSLRLSSLKLFITLHFFKIKPSLWRGRSFDLYGLSRSVPISIISPKITVFL